MDDEIVVLETAIEQEEQVEEEEDEEVGAQKFQIRKRRAYFPSFV